MSLRLLLLVCCLFTTPAFAHQQKSAVTQVLYNSRTGNLEIAHRFYLHDAEHATKQIASLQADLDVHHADILGDESTRAAFAAYVMARFAILDEQQQPLPLNAVGYELDGKFFWVYAETPIPTSNKLVVRHDVLRDIWSEQSNLLNIEGKGQIKSLDFSGKAKLLSVEFR